MSDVTWDDLEASKPPTEYKLGERQKEDREKTAKMAKARRRKTKKTKKAKK